MQHRPRPPPTQLPRPPSRAAASTTYAQGRYKYPRAVKKNRPRVRDRAYRMRIGILPPTQEHVLAHWQDHLQGLELTAVISTSRLVSAEAASGPGRGRSRGPGQPPAARVSLRTDHAGRDNHDAAPPRSGETRTMTMMAEHLRTGQASLMLSALTAAFSLEP